MRRRSDRILTTHIGSLAWPGNVLDLLWAKEQREAYDTGVFMTAVSPSDVEGQQPNQFYKTPEEYLHAIADAMHEECRAIVDAGIILQSDDPRLLAYSISRPDLSVEDCRRWAKERVAAINHALRGIPADRVRIHTCHGINIGPRVHEMNLAEGARIASKQLWA